MSSLSARQIEKIKDLFEMRGGYLLEFSNSSFREFMLSNTNIDMDKEEGYKGKSKARKFIYFLESESDALVGKTILELLQMRQDDVAHRRIVNKDYSDPYSNYVAEIESMAHTMCEKNEMPQNNEERLKATLLSASEVLQDLLDVGESACNNRTYNYSRSEDEINDYFRDMLSAKGYIQVMDQTRHGISANGNGAGEVDILLKRNNKEIAIIEGLKLDCIKTDTINAHIDKAVVNYNALGTPTFIVAYVKTSNFENFWNGAYEYLKGFIYPLEVKKVLEKKAYTNAAIRYADMILSRDGYDFPVYFIAINIG